METTGKDNSTYLRFWLNFKVKKRIETEKRIKGRCTLKERHWKLLEVIWVQDFLTIHRDINPVAFVFFIKHYPGITSLTEPSSLIKGIRIYQQSTP